MHLALLLLGALVAQTAEAKQVLNVWVDKYPGNLQAVLVDTNSLSGTARPTDVTPGTFRNLCGNPDVSADGKTIVFPSSKGNAWSLYIADFDPSTPAVCNVKPIVQGARSEDPRFSPDASLVVYKRDDNIWMYSVRSKETWEVAKSSCQLWGPAFDHSGGRISYTQRCGKTQDSDLVYFLTVDDQGKPRGTPQRVPQQQARYSNWLSGGQLVFAHTLDSGSTPIWAYNPDDTTQDWAAVYYPSKSNAEDGDPYGLRDDSNDFVMVVQDGPRFALYFHDWHSGKTQQITNGINVLGPVPVLKNQWAASALGQCRGVLAAAEEDDITSLSPPGGFPIWSAVVVTIAAIVVGVATASYVYRRHGDRHSVLVA